MPDEDAPPAGDTFTQADIDRIVADRVKRERAKYADYDEVKAKAAQFEQLDSAAKSEVEKATERATAAEAKLAKAEADAIRLTVAMSKGLTESQAKRLVGSTREDLEADADELLATFRPADTGAPSTDTGTGTPQVSLSRKPTELSGGLDPGEPAEPSVAQLLEDIPRL